MNARVPMLIIDDQPVFRYGLRQVIAAEPRFEVVAEAGDGQTGLSLLARHPVEILMLAIRLPDMSGLDIAGRLQARRSPVKVVILSMQKEEELFYQALNLDVKGYLLKGDALADIVKCLKCVAEGEYYLTSSMSASLIRRYQRANNLAGAQPALCSLTPAELRILKLVGNNRTSKEIARQLGISFRTVESHRINISAKLDLHGNHRLLHFAIEHRSDL